MLRPAQVITFLVQGKQQFPSHVDLELNFTEPDPECWKIVNHFFSPHHSLYLFFYACIIFWIPYSLQGEILAFVQFTRNSSLENLCARKEWWFWSVCLDKYKSNWWVNLWWWKNKVSNWSKMKIQSMFCINKVDDIIQPCGLQVTFLLIITSKWVN